MTRNLLIGSAVLILVVLLLYGFAFIHKPADSRIAQLTDAAETLCLSSGSTTQSATLQSRLEAIKGISANAGVETRKSATRGALIELSGALQADQDDKIRECMRPFITKMLVMTQG